LGISEDQRIKLEDLARSRPNSKPYVNSNRSIPADERKKLLEQMKADDEQAMAVLAAQQRKELEAMQGDKFDWQRF
jgi:hypothetical protein